MSNVVHVVTKQRVMVCPYGWRCPAHFMLQKHNGSNVRSLNAYPLFKSKSRCYVCKGLLRGEFQLFITIRPAPWAVTNSDLALKLLAKVVEELVVIANMLDLKAVFVLAVGKIVVRNGRYFERIEVPHVHILVGAKKRIGRFRVSRRDKVRKLIEFSRQWIEQCYVDVFKGLYPKCIDIKWIKYDANSKPRKTKRKKRKLKRGKGKFKLRIYMFKQLVRKGHKPIAVGIHLRRHHKTPSTDDKTLYNNSIRAYDYAYEGMAGGMGGYGGLATRPDGGLGRRELLTIITRLRRGINRGVFMDLQISSERLRQFLKRLINFLFEHVKRGDIDPSRPLWHLYSMYVLVDLWNEMLENVKPINEKWDDDAVERAVHNYTIELQSFIRTLIALSSIDERAVTDFIRYIISSIKAKLEDALNTSGTIEPAGVSHLLKASVRLQILSKKRVKKLLRDLTYVEHIVDKDLNNAATSIINVGAILATYIERSWRRLKKVIHRESDTRKRGRYGKRESRELRFVKALKLLIKQVRSFKNMLEDVESLGNIQYFDRDDFRFEVKEMLRNSYPCFLYANRVVCVDISDVRNVLIEAEDITRYAIAFCRYCLGIRVKPPVEPCYEGDEGCWNRFCSLYNEFFELVEYYRGLLKKLRRDLRARAKMRKRRYRARLKKLTYKFSKLRTVDEFIYGTKLDPFKRALTVFSSWLRIRGYKQLHEFNPHYVNRRYIESTEAYDKFTRLMYYVNGWIDRIEEQTNSMQNN